MKYQKHKNKSTLLLCKSCGKGFSTPTAYHVFRLKQGQKNFYCCRQCQPRTKKELRKCLICGTETSNALYCSRICANRSTGLTGIRLKGHCRDCDAKISTTKRFCKTCYKKRYPTSDPLVSTLEQFRKRGSNSYHACIRQRARQVAEEAGLLIRCKICGYSKVVECCHLHPVSSFPSTTTIVIVNAISNLVGLCPNHHREFDLGLAII